MKIPTMHGVIDRRILVNYRVNPDVLQAVLPPPFHPKLVRGVGIAGICLIRLKAVRPAFVPSWLGIASENAAHRVAVEWRDDTGRLRDGVYIPRRDTSSRLNALVGGRLFPGIHNHARFTVHETLDRFEIALASDDGGTRLSLRAMLAPELPKTSVFPTLAAASAFSRPARSAIPRPATCGASRAWSCAACSGTWTRSPSTRSTPASSRTPPPSRRVPSNSTAPS